MFSTHGVGGHREDSVVQRIQVVTLTSYCADDSDYNGVWWGLDNMGECSNHNVFHAKPSHECISMTP